MTESALDEPYIVAQIDSLDVAMGQHGRGRDGPIRTMFTLLGDRWTNLIVLLLDIGDLRHAELRRHLTRLSPDGAISQRIMTLKLRQLERKNPGTLYLFPIPTPLVSRLGPRGER